MEYSPEATDLMSIKGLGPRTLIMLQNMGIHSKQELIRCYPSDYEAFTPAVTIREAGAGDYCAVKARIDAEAHSYGYGRKAVISFRIRDEEGKTLRVSYFNMAYIKKNIHKGDEKVFRGVIRDSDKYGLSMDQPQMYGPEAYRALTGSIRPVYSLESGFSQKRFTGFLQEALKDCGEVPDLIPDRYLPSGSLSSRDALRQIHFPASRSLLEKARERLVLEEFTSFILRVRAYKQTSSESGNPCPMPLSEVSRRAEESFPFQLTEGQKNAVAEIRTDLSGSRRMNRLLQGDVGSGKTAIALLAMLMAAENGYQSAFMAPTEVLAEQHFERLSESIEKWGLPYRLVLLTGSQLRSERSKNLELIASGQADIVIGTHALIQDGVRFSRLGLVITDEQHRFGVRQRALLGEKGKQPHLLVMSATPIPRTLAMILYGDLDVSLLSELPKGRIPIQNALVTPAARKSAYRLILKEAEEGRRAYIVCPLVEASEGVKGENVVEYTKHLRETFPPSIGIDYLHGQMDPNRKNKVMRDFASGKCQILVCTTVVEVGVDVPEATVMMVENAERFGLAQLHQLRGRVGRSIWPSYAIFVDGSGKKEKNKRLEILCRSNDGFEIAEEDLKLRGPGDLFGIRQSGEMHFAIGDIYQDHAILAQASQLADRILQEDPLLEKDENRFLRKAVIECESKEWL